MLDAAIKLLKRGGGASITTNRIAETAGVSIGSVYQYFPNKGALFAALHECHIAQVADVLQRRLAASAGSSLEGLVASLVDGMAEAHLADPELSELLETEVPHRAGGAVEFSMRFHKPFREALADHLSARRVDLDTRAFFMANMVDALGHAVVLRRPRGLSLAHAKAEACKAIVTYLAS